MYVVRITRMPAAGRSAFEDYVRRLDDVVKKLPGFQSGFQLNSLSHPQKYVALFRWASREAQRAALREPEMRAFAQANPNDGLFTELGLTEAYEVQHETAIQSGVRYAGLVDWDIDVRGAGPAFTESRQEVFELRRKHDSGYGAWLLGLAGTPRKRLVVNFSTEAAARAQSAEEQAWAQAHPGSTYTTHLPDIERYEIILRV